MLHMSISVCKISTPARTTKESANFSHCALTQNGQQCTLKHVPKEKHALSAGSQAANLRNCVPSIQASLHVCDDTAQMKHTWNAQ